MPVVARERYPFQMPFVFVEQGQGLMLTDNWHKHVNANAGRRWTPLATTQGAPPGIEDAYEGVLHWEYTVRTHGLRVDCVVDDLPGGRIVGWRNILVGLSLMIIVGEKPQEIVSLTDATQHTCAHCAEAIEEPMFQAKHKPRVPTYVPHRQNYRMQAHYNGEPTPIGFLRVVVYGVMLRDHG